MIPAEISISLRGNTLLAVALVLLCSVAAFVFYRFTLPPLPPRRRITLSLLRSISLSLLLLLFFEPIVRLVHRDQQPPRVAILLDDSQSMTVKDKHGDRALALREWLRSGGVKNLAGSVRPDYSTFASNLRGGEMSPPDTMGFKGETTDLSNVFTQLKDRIARENIQACVVLSDGEYTIGKNPLYDAKSLGIPIYMIGIGDTNEQKDIVIARVVTNNVAYAETKVPVQVTVRSSGFGGENVEVTISDGNTVLDRKVIQLSEGTREYPVELSVTPKDEGVKKYVVSVSNLPGELTEKNNYHTLFMKVLKNKLKIVLFAGAPNPDVAALRQALLEDGRFAVNAYVQKSQNDFYEGKLSQAILDSADCFIFIAFPGAATSQEILQQVKNAIDRSAKPLMFIAGSVLDYSKLATFQPYLPVVWSSPSPGEIQVFPAPAERYKNHPLITLEGQMTSERWSQLPPINKSNTAFRAKPEANVLCAVQFQNIVVQEPLIITRSINHQRSLAITGENIWQWRLMAQGNPATENFFSHFMANAVRWLTSKDEDKKVRIVSDKQLFTTAEPATFTAQVYDEQFQPVDNAEISVEIRGAAGASQFQLHAVGSGVYQGVADGLSEADYAFTGKASLDGKFYGGDEGKFAVGSVNVEFLDTRMNKTLLEQIAFRTQGKYYDLEASGSLGEDLSREVRFSAKELVQASEIELWNWRYFVAALIFLFALEWFVRKLNGML